MSRIRSALGRLRPGLSRRGFRIAYGVVILLSVAWIASAALGGGLSTASADAVPTPEPRDNVTVIAESGRAGTLVAYNPDGGLLYYNNSRTKYWDVDRVEGTRATVEYPATDTLHSEGPACNSPPCAHNYVERANLTTGETEVVFERVVRKEHAGEWHDHERINETHVLIADILHDEVYIVDTETGTVEWLWNAQSDFDPATSGGPYPKDWTHLNDVEVLDDGRVMVSLRNHDQVVFIEPGEGVQHDWTLGRDGAHDILYEQHNPDYIPEENGGPAVLVSDSENGRVIEYQRENGEWRKTWQWSDEQMQWPRDADRLPNGNTLIVDSHGHRVLEVTPGGDVEWSVGSTMPYDAERLGTGDESTAGESAARLGLTSRSGGDGLGRGLSSPFDFVANFLFWLLPSRVVNAVYFVSPVWMGPAEFGAALVGVLSALTWIGSEAGWYLRDAGVRLRSPVYRTDTEE